MKNGIRKGLAALVLGASVGGLGGCNSQGWKNLVKETEGLFDDRGEKGLRFRPGGAAKGAAAGFRGLANSSNNPRAAAGGHAAANIFDSYGNEQAGQSQQDITVNNYIQPGNVSSSQQTAPQLSIKGGYVAVHPKLEKIVVCTCNFTEDFDRDGFQMYPEEFVGIKDTFSTDEQIRVSLGTSKRMENLNYKLLDSDGKIVDLWDMQEDGVNFCYGAHRLYNGSKINTLDHMIIPSGKYLALWYTENELVGRIEFAVNAKDK